METSAEGEAEERRREHWKLLSSLKTTVEGLVSTNNPNVWSRYGGLQRLHKDMNNILSHGLKNEQVYYKQRDYWPFVWCVRYISPHLASHVEQFSHLEPVLSSGMQSAGESYKAERWLLHSLQVHMLSAQLRPLLRHLGHTRKYYNDDAFLLSEPHVTAMFQCLEAVEQNNPKLLAQVDTVGLSPLKGPPCLGLLKSQSLCVLPGAGGAWRNADLAPRGDSLNRRLTTSNCSLREAVTTSHVSGNATGGRSQNSNSTNTISPASSLGAPWVCVSRPGDSERGVTPPPGSVPVPSISLTESPSPTSLQPEGGDSGEGDYDDGPEYLAIGNLGQRSRRDSRSSTHSSDQGVTPDQGITPDQSLQQSSLAPPPPRRSSFSEGQRGTGRGSKGHTRSFSDTGINQKLRNESAEDDCCMKNYSPFSPQRQDTSTPSSLYMESHGSQYSSVPDGMFRKPSEGQSLISYLSEQDFGSCADLEKENAHFSISESLIAAIELMKYNLRRQEEEGEEEGDSDCEIQQLKQKIRLRRQQIRRSRLPPCSNSQHLFHSTDSGGSRRSSQDSCQGLSDSGSAEEVEECELRDGCEGQSLLAVSQNGLSLSLASLFSDADIKRSVSSSGRSFLSSESISPSFLQSNSAESVAMGLLKQFEGMQLPAASELDWLVPEHDAPQKLLPIPDSMPISPDDGEHADIYKLRIRVRGNLEWAPPRPQIIFNIHPAPKRKVVVSKQNYRCAGCGTRIDPDYIKRLRYCEYLGRYFCQCCHENAQAVVPGRVLRKWDFSKYYVSNFARDLLSKIAGDPLFNPSDINSGLYKKIKALEAVRVLRMQLFHMKNLFKTCRFAKEVLDQFDSLPGHLTEDLHLFSLNDLTAVRNGELAPRMKELLKLGTMHVAGCVLCQAKGFVCEFCGNDKDIIFPFQLNKCQRCEGEPTLLAAGLGGSRAPSPRPSIPLTWRDWKISDPFRLAKALSKNRQEGEGGEEGLEDIMDQGVRSGALEERGDIAEERKGGGGIFHTFTCGKLVKAFSWSKSDDEEQEMTGETDSEREEEIKCDEGGEEDGNDQHVEEKGKEREDGHARREKVNLLKVLHIDRLKKNISKGGRRSSGSETCSSVESLNEVGQQSKGRLKLPGLTNLAKRVSKREIEDEGKTDVKEKESSIILLEKVKGEEERGKAVWDAEHVEKFTLTKLLKPQLSAIFSKGTSTGEEDRSGESDVKRELDTEEKGQQEPPVITRTNWRGRRTRKARRGRKIREGTTEGGESEDTNELDS
ncbi:run domain Beclin-1-interacting and cysteine-rich domain-containing protein isoform X2 [Plectropomus leopardus]|uniref:run domain Beclin-1-interacting and cysteine-rich domain-containing protein isoform X2 n=1 Tax=Plectropomus leopardus TaxID=160734 RepID=UPI001C4C86D6|nr:run domain Beclin-1-interacting and cysteine-rich domain-containing protein isoform X2 [Plectropomus leopardus]